jgi:Flp pilus assembly protein TadG
MKKKYKNQKGVAILEFALIALAFFLLLFGLMEFGFLLFNQQVVTNAAREGARFGIVARPIDYKVYKVDVENEARAYAESNIISFGANNFEASAEFETGEYCSGFQDVLTVDVTYEYSFLVLPFAKKTLGSTAVMICE